MSDMRACVGVPQLYRLELHKDAIEYKNTKLGFANYDAYLSIAAISQVGKAYAIRTQAKAQPSKVRLTDPFLILFSEYIIPSWASREQVMT